MYSLILFITNPIAWRDYLTCYSRIIIDGFKFKIFLKHPQYSEMIIYFEVIDLYLCGLELLKKGLRNSMMLPNHMVYQVWKALRHVSEAIILHIQLPLLIILLAGIFDES